VVDSSDKTSVASAINTNDEIITDFGQRPNFTSLLMAHMHNAEIEPTP